MKKLKTKFKVVLLGDMEVGKTCIIKYFDKKKFKDTSIITVGKTNTIKTLELDDRRTIKLDIMDISGAEFFRDIAQGYINGAAVVFLVYDITNKTSFDSIKNYWYKEVKENVKENTRKY